MRMGIKFARFSSAFILMALAGSSGIRAQDDVRKKHPGKLGTLLSQVADAHDEDGDEKAHARAESLGLQVRGGGAAAEVTAILEPLAGKGPASIDREELARLGAAVTGESESFLRVRVPIRSLRRLGAHAGIRVARSPAAARALDGLGSNLSESVALTGASQLQQGGLTGAGVKVAVVDLGFIGLSSTIAAGELPANTVKVLLLGQSGSTYVESYTSHGTGVAEHVADMAPGAQIHCIRVEDEIDLQNAASYCVLNGIGVANHSVGWVNQSYYDGTGPISSIFNSSNAKGLFWCVAAGNDADRHWRGEWLDVDNDRYLDLANAPEDFLALSGNAGTVQLFLNWNQYGNSVTDLDLYVMNKNNQTVASSLGFQSGPQAPAEAVAFTYSALSAPYRVRVFRYGSGPTAGLNATLFCFTHGLTPAVAGSSLMDPAAAPGVFTVGAINQVNYAQSSPALEYFSSQGPTTDGRLKPDITAPDGTTCRTYGAQRSFGTSFSSPTTAGAAALLRAQNPSLSAPQLAAALRKLAIDVGPVGADPQFGAGKLALTTNAPPTAAALAVATAVDTPITITLAGTDGEGAPLTYEIVSGSGPFLGSLSGTAPNLTYTPSAGVAGSDSFSYRVDDGIWDSAPAVVSLSISAGNRPPVANAQSVGTVLGIAVPVTLTGSDPDGDPLTFAIVTSPAHGSLSGDAPNLTYAPEPGYAGPDGFTFKVSDGSADSAPVAISILVLQAPNTPPVAQSQSVSTEEDTAVAITLAGTDADGNPLTYAVLTPPARGVLSGLAPNLTYTPNADANGPDSFTFKVNDGLSDSAAAIVSIAVNAMNDAPIATPLTLSTVQSTALAITLAGTDVDGDPLTFAVGTPAHGTLSGAAPSLTYVPEPGYSGPDSFTFMVTDGSLQSPPATVSITVTAAASIVYADDGFESNNFIGGTGSWLGAWLTSGDVGILADGGAHGGTRHVRLRRSTGLMMRSMAVAGLTSVRLKFWSKQTSFEGADQAVVKVSTNGGTTWTIVKTFTAATAPNVYAFHEAQIDVSGQAFLLIAFDANMNSASDQWYVDDIQVTN
jgi:hypothetical protein